MKILSIGYSIPSKGYSNEESINYWLKNLRELSYFKRPMYRKVLLKILERTGAKYRYARDITKGETAYEHIMNAMNKALEKANLAANDIDLLIYCGVGKGFIEPSNAYMYAKEIGMKSTECFDVVDACMSWTRTMQLCSSFLKCKTYKKIMVVTGEFHLGLRDTHKIPSLESLEYNFPMYTIGEAATATILEDSEQHWNFNFMSRPEHAALCTIPIEGFDSYIPKHEKIGHNGPGKFVSYGKELLNAATPLLKKVVAESISDTSKIDLFIPHAPSKKVYTEGFKDVGIASEKLYSKIYESYGNLVSSSVPTALAMAFEENRINRGSKVALIPASAGLSVAAVTFTF